MTIMMMGGSLRIKGFQNLIILTIFQDWYEEASQMHLPEISANNPKACYPFELKTPLCSPSTAPILIYLHPAKNIQNIPLHPLWTLNPSNPSLILRLVQTPPWHH